MPVNLRPHSDDEHDEATIEVVPLIDIMFFLLASFMMVSLSMTQMQRVPINVPSSSTGNTQTTQPPIQIAMDANGVITIDHKIVTFSEVTAFLKQASPSPQNLNVTLSADQATTHGMVIQLLDAVRLSGASNIQFETRAK